MRDQDKTSKTLLERLKDQDDHGAWQDFFDFYAGLILRFARYRGCSDTMSNDVLQETMLVLFKKMPDFQYDPAIGRFRSFLFRIVQGRVQDAFRREQRYMFYSSIRQEKFPGRSQLLEDGLDDPLEEWEREWENNIFATALERVKRKVDGSTFRSFRLYVLEQKEVADVSEALGLDRNTIYQHKNRLMTMLRREVDGLRQELGETG